MFNIIITKTMRVYQVSKVAAMVNMNPYEKACDILESTWKKENKISYYNALNNCNPESSYENDINLLHKALNTNEAKNILNSCNESKDITSKVNIIDSVPTSFEKHQEELLKKHIKSKYSTSYGTKTEKSALELYNDIKNCNCKQNTITHTHKIDDFAIRGKIDSSIVIEDKLKIVEIKNRTKKLFYDVRLYENVQIQLYMYMHESKSAHLVENFKGNINIIDIDYDEVFTQIIIEKLKIFNNVLNKLLIDPDYQLKYFSSCDRSSFIFT